MCYLANFTGIITPSLIERGNFTLQRSELNQCQKTKPSPSLRNKSIEEFLQTLTLSEEYQHLILFSDNNSIYVTPSQVIHLWMLLKTCRSEEQIKKAKKGRKDAQVDLKK